MHVKSASFSTDNSGISRLSIFYRISNHKIFILKYLDNALTDFSQTSRTSGRILEEKAALMILEEQFPVPIYTAVSKIGNSVTMTTPMSLQP